MRKQRRTVDPSVKLEVVRMIKEQGLSVRHVSQSVDVGQTAIRRWLTQYEAEVNGKPGIGNPLTVEQQRILDVLHEDAIPEGTNVHFSHVVFGFLVVGLLLVKIADFIRRRQKPPTVEHGEN